MAPTRSTTINELIQALVYAADTVEDVMIFHGWRVAVFGDWLTRAIAPQRRQEIFQACMVHDIGGVGLPNHILHYHMPREAALRREVIAHPLKGATLVSGIPGLFESAKLVMDHHERYDGSGYPRRKRGDEIPAGAQLIGLADELDTALHQKKIRSRKDIGLFINDRLSGKFAPLLLRTARSVWKERPLPGEIPVEQWIYTYYYEVVGEIGPLQVEGPGDALTTTLEVFADIIDAKHPSTLGHSRRVARYSVMIGLAMDLSAEEVTSLKWASLLHDIGKLSIPGRVLDKPTLLTEKEYTSMKRHVEFTRAILDRISGFEEISRVAYGHHERWDGTGYPQGLAGEEIPLLARVLAVSDTFDAMTSGRIYRTGRSSEEACAELKRCAGVHFDRRVIEAAVPVLSHLVE